jgi:hypothetical protein
MPIPLALTDEQMDSVLRAAAPLQPRDRAPFLEALAQALSAQPLIGDGSIHRAIADTQKRFFDPPRAAAGFKDAGKYGRRRGG